MKSYLGKMLSYQVADYKRFAARTRITTSCKFIMKLMEFVKKNIKEGSANFISSFVFLI
jgi:hypothetical protein